jgi:ubiquinone/menaquinone biosynthesis C-methylase UbiE
LAQRGFSVYATDISLTGIDIAEGKAKLLKLDNIQFKQHDMRNIPFPNNFFDAVICTWTIYHGTLDEIKKTVSEIWRVLMPNGVVITDFLSISDSTYGIGKEIERNTFLGAKHTEEDVPHHYSTREELIWLFSQFQGLKIRSVSNAYIDKGGENYIRKYFNVEAVK